MNGMNGLGYGILGLAALALLPQLVTAQSLMPARDSVAPDSAQITIFADGTARALLTDSDSGGDEAGSGAIGALIRTSKWSLRVNINAAPTADSIRAGFGTFLLDPSVGSKSGGIEIERDSLFGRKGLALRVYTSIATTVWTDTLSSSNATMTGVGVLLVRSVNGRDSENDIYSMRFFGGFSHRAIGGDISDEEALRTRALGTVAKTFWGLEGGVQMSLRNVTAGMRFNYLLDPEEGQVDGLTKFQATFGINIYGPLMTKKLRLF